MTRARKPRYSVPTLGGGHTNNVERNSDMAVCFAPRTMRLHGPIQPQRPLRWWHRFLGGAR